MPTGIIDYGAGNVRSVCNTLDAIGAERKMVGSPDELEGIDSLIFPGVGAFGDCSRNLSESGLMDPLRDWIAANKPFLGICIGFQMLFEGSSESPGSPGLGSLPGTVVRFPDESGLKVPHMGWNHLELTDPSDPAWAGLGDSPHFYFVHSYFPEPADPSIAASTTNYGRPFTSSVRRGNLFATQFHPEKSQAAGARLIRNFLDSTE
jgi:glutamine amidotransferase